jgi:hypothetical protein
MPRNRTRSLPRISLNKLGEYLVAKPGRRHSIIRDQKKPKDFIVARYADAVRAIQRHITEEHESADQLNKAVRTLSTADHDSKWKRDTADLCAKALFAFMSIADEVPTNGFKAIMGEDSPEKMNIAGVDVSVRPEILLIDPEQNNQIVGGIKLYLGKDNPLEDASDFVGSVLYRYLAEVLSTEAAVSHKNCFVVDVFAGEIIPAPKAYKRNMNDVSAACTEISALWTAL